MLSSGLWVIPQHSGASVLMGLQPLEIGTHVQESQGSLMLVLRLCSHCILLYEGMYDSFDHCFIPRLYGKTAFRLVTVYLLAILVIKLVGGPEEDVK